MGVLEGYDIQNITKSQQGHLNKNFYDKEFWILKEKSLRSTATPCKYQVKSPKEHLPPEYFIDLLYPTQENGCLHEISFSQTGWLIVT